MLARGLRVFACPTPTEIHATTATQERKRYLNIEMFLNITMTVCLKRRKYKPPLPQLANTRLTNRDVYV
jgi:hypothetical protein